MRVLNLSTLLIGVLFGDAAVAEYAVTSKLEGWFCTGFVFEMCSLETIDAISDEEGGQLFEFVGSLDSVSDFNELQGRCWLNNSPGYHAYRRLPAEEWELIGVPDNFTFKCERE